MRIPHAVLAIAPAFALSALSGVAACSSGSSGSQAADAAVQEAAEVTDVTDAGGSDAADTGASATLAFPKIIDHGVPQMTSPRLVTMTFQGDPMASQLQAFGQ